MAGHMGMDQVTTRNHPLVKRRRRQQPAADQGSPARTERRAPFRSQGSHGEGEEGRRSKPRVATVASSMDTAMIEVPIYNQTGHEGRHVPGRRGEARRRGAHEPAQAGAGRCTTPTSGRAPSAR